MGLFSPVCVVLWSWFNIFWPPHHIRWAPLSAVQGTLLKIEGPVTLFQLMTRILDYMNTLVMSFIHHAAFVIILLIIITHSVTCLHVGITDFCRGSGTTPWHPSVCCHTILSSQYSVSAYSYWRNSLMPAMRTRRHDVWVLPDRSLGKLMDLWCWFL